MANAVIQLRNTTSRILSLDLGKVGRKRAIRAALQPVGSTHGSVLTDRVDVGDIATLDELNLNPQLLTLITAGTVALSIARGSNDIPGSGVFEVNDSGGLGLLYGAEVAMSALTTGTADDVTIINPLPFAVEVVDCFINVATAVALSTVTLRDAAAGAGNALSSALSSASTGLVRNVLATGPIAVAAGGAIYARRSDRAVVGSVHVLLKRTA